jgi:hypothetical protein|tara:strand:- start:368 stop:616 length:249 start_codon:yes stop_codon:yes gene_type:complete
MKKSKHLKKKQKKHNPVEIKVSSFKDQFLKADISVKGTDVLINVGGFFNELDAMMWAKMQTELWLQTGQQENKDNITTRTLH